MSDPQDDRIVELEHRLDGLERGERQAAFDGLLTLWRSGGVAMPPERQAINVHLHTFHSYNAYGYSPTRVAWLARQHGLAVAGIVDFDVLAGMDEFLAAARALDLRATVGMETRVFIPEFADCVITSPGEPGISYHMGVGFPNSQVPASQQGFLHGLKKTAQQRNRDLMQRVNEYLSPVELDYERDVLALTPAGNATERHMCLAYARKAVEHFGSSKTLVDFWARKLGVGAETLDLPEGRNLLNTIRAKTMKRGGVGYVQPDKGSFPLMADTNRFILACGGIPTHTWLDGTSDGERDIEELLDVAMSTGAVAINVIPDRNYTPGKQDDKVKNLYEVIEVARRRHLVVVGGTEMNSPGQKFVDDFGTGELAPLLSVFLTGAYIVYAHSVLQQQCGLGYTSPWAERHFRDRAARNEFFAAVGRSIQPDRETKLSALGETTTPDEVLRQVEQ